MRVAAVTWELRKISREGEFYDHLIEVLQSCAELGAAVAVLPEFFSFELLSANSQVDESEVASMMSPHWNAIVGALSEGASRQQMTIVGGSHIVGKINRCPIVTPSGETFFVDKHVLTQYEKSPLGLLPGDSCRVHQDLGACVCYDCEFPAGAKAIAEAGAKILAVPAFTETSHGFHRVRRCCEARAIENQMFVVHSSLVGSIGFEPIPNATGSSAILAPCIEPFPENGVLAETPFNQESVAIADLDLGLIDEVRTTGDVRNWQDRDAATWSPTR